MRDWEVEYDKKLGQLIPHHTYGYRMNRHHDLKNEDEREYQDEIL